MKARTYICRGCGIGCELKSTVTPNQCVQRQPGEYSGARWEEAEKRKASCKNCYYYADAGNVPYCTYRMVNNPVRKCDYWREAVEE